MKAQSATIAVSGLSVAGTLAPGLPVMLSLRSERQFRGTIVGLSHDPLDPPNYAPDVVDRVFLVPYPGQGGAQLFQRIEHAHSRQAIDALIPTLDSELPLYLEIASRLQALGIGIVLPDAATLGRRSKMNLGALAPRLGLRAPYSRVAYNYNDALTLGREFLLPFMVKGHYYGAIPVHSLDQLPSAATAVAGSWGYPLVLQEYIPGTEYDTAALGDGKGRLLGAVPMKKLQLDGRGKAWGGMTVEDPQLVRAAHLLAAELEWPGPMEIEVMRHFETNEPYLIEVNPRFPAWVQLTAAAGQNLPWALARLACGEKVEPFESYQVGVMSLRRNFDVACPSGIYESLVMDGEVDLRAPSQSRMQPYWFSTREIGQEVEAYTRTIPASEDSQPNRDREGVARTIPDAESEVGRE
jgi:carbamoyl-phosphate synthase large subunit